MVMRKCSITYECHKCPKRIPLKRVLHFLSKLVQAEIKLLKYLWSWIWTTQNTDNGIDGISSPYIGHKLYMCWQLKEMGSTDCLDYLSIPRAGRKGKVLKNKLATLHTTHKIEPIANWFNWFNSLIIKNKQSNLWTDPVKEE